MKIQAGKKQKSNKESKAVANWVAQEKSVGELGAEFMDNRSEMVAQRKIQTLVNNYSSLQSIQFAGTIQRTTIQQRGWYLNSFATGYNAGWLSGVTDGIDELINAGIINQVNRITVINQANGARQAIGIITVPNMPWYDDEYVCRDNGRVAGNGLGFDRGYAYSITRYGYARQYNAIPNGNRTTALNDNGGTCVYCNLRATADVDHVIPLKEHWRRIGSGQGRTARSTHANDVDNLVGSCATCNRAKGARIIYAGWSPPAWNGTNWWPYGPTRASNVNGGQYW